MRVLGFLTLASCHLVAFATPGASAAQRPGGGARQAGDTLSLAVAVRYALGSSASLRAAREGVAAAQGRERQAGAWTNPVFLFSREQTSAVGAQSVQDIASLEQPLDLAQQRGARAAVARLAREAMELRLQQQESDLAFGVIRAFAQGVTAARRVELARRTVEAFAYARRVSDARLAAGDISGFAARRLKLEAARYAALLAEAIMNESAAQATLGALLPGLAVWAPGMPLDGRGMVRAVATADTADGEPLRQRALSQRADVRLATIESDMADAQQGLAERERLPMPVLSLGFKREGSVAPGIPRVDLSGFVAGFSVPLPLFDRRGGAVDAAAADHRQRIALRDSVRNAARRDVSEALAARRAVEEQVAMLQPLVEVDAPAALRAAQASYDEGEITLLEWLDAVRAYYETESAYVALIAERTIRRAALARAIGSPLSSIIGSLP